MQVHLYQYIGGLEHAGVNKSMRSAALGQWVEPGVLGSQNGYDLSWCGHGQDDWLIQLLQVHLYQFIGGLEHAGVNKSMPSTSLPLCLLLPLWGFLIFLASFNCSSRPWTLASRSWNISYSASAEDVMVGDGCIGMGGNAGISSSSSFLLLNNWWVHTFQPTFVGFKVWTIDNWIWEWQTQCNNTCCFTNDIDWSISCHVKQMWKHWSVDIWIQDDKIQRQSVASLPRAYW